MQTTFGTFSSGTVCLEKSLSTYVCLPFFIATSNHARVFRFRCTRTLSSQRFSFPFRKFKHWSKFVIATRLQLNIIYDPIFQVRQASLGKWINAIWKVFFLVRCSVMFTWLSVCVCVLLLPPLLLLNLSSLDAKHQPRDTLMSVGWMVRLIFLVVLCALHCSAVKLHTNNTPYMQFTCIKTLQWGNQMCYRRFFALALL